MDESDAPAYMPLPENVGRGRVMHLSIDNETMLAMKAVLQVAYDHQEPNGWISPAAGLVGEARGGRCIRGGVSHPLEIPATVAAL